MFLCECGCGKETKWNAQKKEYNKRCVGHYERTSESKETLSNSQKKRFQQNPELREKISKFQKKRGFFSKYNKTEKHSKEAIKSNQNRLVTEKTKQKIAESLKGHKRSPESILKGKITTIDNESHLGNNNSQWKGGVSFRDDIGEWIKLSKEIKKRDKFTCQDCGKILINLVAHHIDFDKNNHEPLNLITLCKKCHAKKHKEHGDYKK